MATTSTQAPRREPSPQLRRLICNIEEQIPAVIPAHLDAIWAQIPAYPAAQTPTLRVEVEEQARALFATLLATLTEGRPPRVNDFPVDPELAARRLSQGIGLADCLQAHRIAQSTLWHAVLNALGDSPEEREAALSIVDLIMQVIEVGSAVTGEAFVAAQQLQLAEMDRVRRDLIEDLLAGRAVAPGAKDAAARKARLVPAGGGLVVICAAPPGSSGSGDETQRRALTTLRRVADQHYGGLVIRRQDELVGVLAVSPQGPEQMLGALASVCDQLARASHPLGVGVSTVYPDLAGVPYAFSEAAMAREWLRGGAGLMALPAMSTFDYFVRRDDDTVRRLIPVRIRDFVQEDMAVGATLVDTLREYIATNLNASATAKNLHLHVNTAYYRLERIASRTGADLRSISDLLEVLIAVRLLTGSQPPAGEG